MAIVKKYQAEIVSLKNSIDGVYTIEFRSLDKPFRYSPGQFLHLALDEYDPAGQWPESRCFSMQSAPGEELIKITYAVKGKFTKRMQHELKPGNQVTLKLPFGDLFTKPHNKTNTVFIAGGTGITPFLSLFTHESFNEYTNPRIYLGFRSKAHNIYHTELNRLQSMDLIPSNSLKFVYEDIDGSLDIQNIFSENDTLSDYFISGPPTMIKSFKQALIANGLPTQHILTDDWD